MRIEVPDRSTYWPLTHALVVAKPADGTLSVFNARKNHWESFFGYFGDVAYVDRLREECGAVHSP